MDKVAFLNFLSAAKKEGASGADVAATIKEATGEDVDPQQLEAMMGQLPEGGMPQEHEAAMPQHPQHAQHHQHPQHHGHPAHAHNAPNAEATEEHNIPLNEQQIDALAQEIAQHIAMQEQGGQGGPDMQGMQGGPDMQGGQGQNPMEGISPEHMQGLDLAKSAEYISGFIQAALIKGASVEEAIDIYGTQLSNTVALLKDASARETDIKKLAEKLDEDTLAYFEGVAQKAASEGWSYDETVAFLKQAGMGELLKEKLK